MRLKQMDKNGYKWGERGTQRITQRVQGLQLHSAVSPENVGLQITIPREGCTWPHPCRQASFHATVSIYCWSGHPCEVICHQSRMLMMLMVRLISLSTH